MERLSSEVVYQVAYLDMALGLGGCIQLMTVEQVTKIILTPGRGAALLGSRRDELVVIKLLRACVAPIYIYVSGEI